MKHIPETPKEDFRNHSQAMPNHGNPLVVQSLNSVNTALRRWIKCPVVRCLWFSIRNWPQKLTLPKQSLGDLNPLIYHHIAPEREIANTIHIQLCHDAFTMPFSYYGPHQDELAAQWVLPIGARHLSAAHRFVFMDHPMLSPWRSHATPAPWWWRSNGI